MLSIGELVGYLGVDASAFDSGLESAEGKLGKLGVAAGAAGLAAGGALAAGLFAAMDVEKANDKLTAQLGLTEAESERIGGVAGALYAGAYGENLGEVNGAVAEVMSSFDGMRNASSEDLQALTANAMDFATAMEVDVAEGARTAGVLVKTGLAKDAKEAFDLLTVASQEAGPAMVEPIMEAASLYGVNFNAIGISGHAAMAILVDASKGGEEALDKAGDAVKEFAIKAVDLGDKGAQEALAGLGLSGRQMADDLLAGGDTAQQAFMRVVDGLQKIKSPSDQAATSVALFGTPLEDLSKDQIPVFLDAMSQAGGELENVAGATDRVGAGLAGNAASNLTMFKRGVMTTFVDVVGGKALPVVDKLASVLAVGLGPALDAVGGTLGAVGGIVEDVTGFLSEHETTSRVLAGVIGGVMVPILGAVAVSYAVTAAAAVASAVTQGVAWATLQAQTIAYNAIRAYAFATGIAGWLLSAATATASALTIAAAWLIALGPVGWIIAGIGLVIAIVVLLWQHSETFRDIVTGAFGLVKDAAGAMVDFIKAGFGFLVDLFLNFTGPGLIIKHWDTIKAVTGAAWDWVQRIVAESVGRVIAVLDGLGEIPGKVGAWFGAAKDAAAQKLGDLVGTVAGLPGRVLGALGDLGGLLRDAGGRVIQGFVDGITSGFQWVRDQLGKLTDLLPDWKGPAARDAMILRGSGLLVMGGFESGLLDGFGSVESSLGDMTARLARNAVVSLPPVTFPVGSGPRGGDGAAASTAAPQSAAGFTYNVEHMHVTQAPGEELASALPREMANRAWELGF